MSWVYFIRPVGADGPVKIGCSTLPERRLSQYLTWSPLPLEIVARVPGGQELEQRFHAAFIDSHSHHEWFHGSPALSGVLDAIRGGVFDVASLPAPSQLPRKSGHTAESRRSGGNARRISWMRRRGAQIPQDVEAATHTYYCDTVEKARRRKIVADFLADHDAGRTA